MSEYLANRLKLLFPNIIVSDVTYNTLIELNCDIHGSYTKSVSQILYKNPNCPECTRVCKNKKLSEIGKTKIGSKNSFYGHKHSEETLNKLRHPLSELTKHKISDTVKSEQCQSKIKHTKILKYGNANYVNSSKMRQTKLNDINEFKIANEVTEYKELVKKYGNIKLKDINTIIYKNVLFVYNKDINKIIDQSNYINPNAGISYKEKELVNFIKTFYKNDILENRRKIIYPKELDIYIPDLKLAIEFNGNYWHSQEIGCPKDYHLQKSLLCRDKGIRLIHIYEFEDFEEQKQLLKDLILGIDNYNQNDFNKNNFLDDIPKLYKNSTNKGTVYSIGKCY